MESIISKTQKAENAILEFDDQNPKYSIAIRWRQAGLVIDYEKAIQECLGHLEAALNRLGAAEQ